MSIFEKITRYTQLRQSAPFDLDAPVCKDLSTLSYTDLHALRDEASVVSSRARIRYLAALFPDLGLVSLAESVHAIIDNPNLSVGDVRLILDGRSLADPTRRTREVDLHAIQTIGRLISSGVSVVGAARRAGVSRTTARSVDEYLGLSQVYHDRAMDITIDLTREGASTRAIADVLQVSQSTACRWQRKARSVLKELGEL